MKILFVSTLNLATNPRFVKEIKLALTNGFSAEVICFEFDNWSYDFNRQLVGELSGAKFHIIPAGRKPFLPWAASVVWEKFYRLTGALIPLPPALRSKGISRRSGLLVKEIKKLNKLWKIPFIIVTHDLAEAKKLSDEIIFLENGKRVLKSF